jgi:hypothetical protein
MTISSAAAEPSVSSVRRARILLAASAAAAVLLYWAYVDVIRPLPTYTPRFDPEMPYMLNSLAVFKSQAYTYVDHPGTPLEVIGSLILVAQKVALRIPSEDLIQFTLENPRVFLLWVHALLAVGSAVTVFLLVAGYPVRRTADLLPAVAAAFLFFAAHSPTALATLSFWSHNSFNFPAGTLLLLIVVLRLRKGDGLSHWETLLFGLISGGLAAVQLYFATWPLGLSVMLGTHRGLKGRSLLRGLGEALWVGAGAAAGFFLATQPILHRYREFIWWVRGLILHQGNYAQGPRGVTSLALVGDHLRQLWSEGGAILLATAAISLVMVAAAVVLARRGRAAPTWWWAAVVGSTLQLAVAFGLILKHPGSTYLLAVAAILPILSILAWEVLASSGRLGRAVVTAASLLVLVGLGWAVARSLQDHQRSLAYITAARAELDRVTSDLVDELKRDPDSLVRLWGYDAPSACLALRFGNGYVEGLFGGEIDRACPRDFQYNIWLRRAELPDAGGFLNEVDGWDLLILPTRHLPENVQGLRVVLTSSETGLSYVLPPKDP